MIPKRGRTAAKKWEVVEFLRRNTLRSEIRPAIKGSFIPKYLWPLRLRNNRHVMSGVEHGQRGILRPRRKAQPQSSHENKPKMKSSQPGNKRTQAQSDTADKSRGNRHGRKFHGARFNRTSVSMWYVCGKRSNMCISAIS